MSDIVILYVMIVALAGLMNLVAYRVDVLEDRIRMLEKVQGQKDKQ